jgi:hypothetical protein
MLNRLLALIKSTFILAAILLVWVALILLTWRGWLQLFTTLLTHVIKNEDIELYNYNLWLAQDQDVNVIFGGKPDETISSRVGIEYLKGSRTASRIRGVVDWIFYIAVKQVNHCVASIEWQEQTQEDQDRYKDNK